MANYNVSDQNSWLVHHKLPRSMHNYWVLNDGQPKIGNERQSWGLIISILRKLWSHFRVVFIKHAVPLGLYSSGRQQIVKLVKIVKHFSPIFFRITFENFILTDYIFSSYLKPFLGKYTQNVIIQCDFMIVSSYSSSSFNTIVSCLYCIWNIV